MAPPRKRIDDPVTKPFRRVNTMLPAALVSKLDREADETERSRTGVIRYILSEYFRRREESSELV